MNRRFLHVGWLSIATLIASCGGGSESESRNDAASSSGPGADAAKKNDTAAPSADVQPGPLAGALLELVGSWSCSSSSMSTTYVLTATTMHQDTKLASVSRVLEGNITGFSTDRQEYDTGKYTDGFLIVQITRNEGLQIAEPGEYGRLSWQDVATGRKKLLLDSAYFDTAEEAAAKLPTSYSMWDTCTRSTPKDAASPPDATGTKDAASPTDATSAKDAASLLDAVSSPDGTSPLDAGSSPDGTSPLDAGSSPDGASPLDAGMPLDASATG